MKTLKESILAGMEDTIASGDVLNLFARIVNTKTEDEYNKCVNELKQKLDAELGSAYETVYKEIKTKRKSLFLAIIANSEYHIGNDILINYGKTCILVRFLNDKRKTIFYHWNQNSLYKYLTDWRVEMYGFKDYCWKLNKKWSIFHDAIVNNTFDYIL